MNANDRNALALLERHPGVAGGLELATVAAAIIACRKWLADEPWSAQAQAADYLAAVAQHSLARFVESLPPDQSLALMKRTNEDVKILLDAIEEARGNHDD